MSLQQLHLRQSDVRQILASTRFDSAEVHCTIVHGVTGAQERAAVCSAFNQLRNQAIFMQPDGAAIDAVPVRVYVIVSPVSNHYISFNNPDPHRMVSMGFESVVNMEDWHSDDLGMGDYAAAFASSARRALRSDLTPSTLTNRFRLSGPAALIETYEANHLRSLHFVIIATGIDFTLADVQLLEVVDPETHIDARARRVTDIYDVGNWDPTTYLLTHHLSHLLPPFIRS